MARPSRREKYDLSDLSLQIEKDLSGAIRLGQLQAELLKQVQASLSKLTLASQGKAGPGTCR
jgi:hypothetical protein